jgi:calmodulin
VTGKLMALNVDPWHIDDVKATFALFDLNGDGDLCTEDWMKVLQLCNVETTTKSVEEAMARVDADGNKNGKVDFETFVSMLKSDDPRCAVDLTKSAFEFFDAGGKGEIKAEDLVRGFKEMGEDLTLEAAQNIMGIIDMDADGRVTLPDFAASCA